jgi:hypothetical protein
MSVTQLGYLGIGVSDIAVWEQFATQTLGLQLNERADDGALFLKLAGTAAHPRQHLGAPPTGGAAGSATYGGARLMPYLRHSPLSLQERRLHVSLL